MRPFAHTTIECAVRAVLACSAACGAVALLPAPAVAQPAPGTAADKTGTAAKADAAKDSAGKAQATDAPSDGAPKGAEPGSSGQDGAGPESARPEGAKTEEGEPKAGDSAKPDGDPGKRSALTRELAEQGEADLFKSVRVFQQRYLVKTKRVELVIGGATSFADPFAHHFSADAALLFHLNEYWAIGGGASKWFGSVTDGFHQIETDYSLFPEESRLQAGGWGEVQFSPVAGKFSGFGLGVLQGDAYLLAGGGGARTTRGESVKGFGLVGTGVRMHIARWVSLSMEIRDMIVVEGFLDNQSRVLQHWFGGIKLGLWLPPSVQYKYPR